MALMAGLAAASVHVGAFRNWITADGSSGFKAEAGRYHIYVSFACPYAHRTLLTRRIKGLEHVISIDVMDIVKGDEGWKFGPNPNVDGPTSDSIHGFSFLREVYFKVDPNYSGRFTVPVLFDKVTGTIVNNESAEIIRMLNTEFNEFCATPEAKALDLYPTDLRDTINELNEWIAYSLSSAVYRAGFAIAQNAYDKAVSEVFESLDRVEGILSTQRYLTGAIITEADVRLYTTLVRFDPVYVGHFKCNKKRIVDYPNIWGYLRDLYNTPGFGSTTNHYHISHHYQASHLHVNPHGIVSIGPEIDYSIPHGRDKKF